MPHGICLNFCRLISLQLGRGYTAHTLHEGDMRSARDLRAVFCTDGGDERSHMRGQFWVLIDLATGQCVGQVGLELKDASIGVGELRRMAVRASHRNHRGGAMLIEVCSPLMRETTCVQLFNAIFALSVATDPAGARSHVLFQTGRALYRA